MIKFVKCLKNNTEVILIALSDIIAIHKEKGKDVVETHKGNKYEVMSDKGIGNAIVKY